MNSTWRAGSLERRSSKSPDDQFPPRTLVQRLEAHQRLPLVRRLRRQFQLPVHLVQQFLRLLGVPLQVPFVRPLRIHYPLPRLPAQPLCRRKVRMPSGRNVLLRSLCDGNASKQQQGRKDGGNHSDFCHSGDCKVRPAPAQYWKFSTLRSDSTLLALLSTNHGY